MFEEVDSLGVSQGQGRGFAQVFDSTYNPVFKEETARLIKEDKEGKKAIDKQLESIDSGVWFRDQPLVQEKILELQKYAQDNPRNIIKGNTNEALEYKKKITDLKALVYNAKLAEQQTSKYLFALKEGGDKWDQEESRKTIQQFVESPGNYDFSKFQLVPSFSMAKYEKQFMQPEVSKLINTITQSSKKDEFGNYNYDQVEKTSKSAMDNWANRMWNDGNSKMKQTYGSLDEFKQAVYDYGNLELKKNVKTPYVDPNQKAQEKLNLIVTDMVEDTVSIPIGSGDTTKKAFTQGKVPAIQQMPGNFTTNINFPPTEMKKLNAKPLSVFGIYQAKDGKVKSDSYDTDFWTKGVEDQGASEFEPKLVKSYAVFTPKLDSKGNPVDTKNFKKENGELYLLADGKRWIPVNNILLDKENIKNNKFRGVSLGDENVSWVPHIVGTYGKKLSDDQTNFDVAIPYDEGYKNYVGANKGGQDIKNFEAVVNEKDPTILQIKSYSKGTGGKGVQQPTQTRTANDNTQKQTKIKPMTRDEFNAFAKSKGKVATDDDYKKYLNKLEE